MFRALGTPLRDGHAIIYTKGKTKFLAEPPTGSAPPGHIMLSFFFSIPGTRIETETLLTIARCCHRGAFAKRSGVYNDASQNRSSHCGFYSRQPQHDIFCAEQQ